MDTLTATDRETAKAIYRLTAEGGAARTGDLAAALQVAPASITARVQRLAERGAVIYTPYQGAELTREGRRISTTVIRRHRIVERFLSDMLGFPWVEADQLATAFEHELPDDVVARLYVRLERPATCPHGFPIPAAGATELSTLPTLDQLEPGVQAQVALSGQIDEEVRDFLDGIGVRPGATLTVLEQHRFAGPVVITVEDRDRTIGNRVARQIFVRS